MQPPSCNNKSITYAVCVYLVDSSEGHLRIVLDDVQKKASSAAEWIHFSFFTEMSADRECALAHSMSDQDYLALGQTVMARLVALRKLDE